MVSKEEYKNFIAELTRNSQNSSDLKYLSKEYADRYKLLLLFGALILFLGFLFFESLLFVFFIVGGFFVGLGSYFYMKVNKIKFKYKKEYMEKIIDFLLKGHDYVYVIDEMIGPKIFLESQFCETYREYNGGDRLSINISNDDGTKSSTYLNLCHLEVTDIVKESGNKRSTVVVYDGVFGYVDLPFEFKSVLCINSKYKKEGVELKKIILEDIDFNKKFDVYCNDQIEARYILTPDVMLKLILLSNKYEYIKIVFVDKRMYIGFPYRDLLGMREYVDDITSVFEGLYDDIDNIMKIVNVVKQNNKIFKI